MDTSKYLSLFVSEATEQVRALERHMLELERDPTQRDALDGAFRAVHSLKGMAATMGFSEIAECAHRMEDLMDLFRKGGTFESACAEALIAGIDRIGVCVRARAEGGGEPPADSSQNEAVLKTLVAKLEAEVAKRGAAEVKRVVTTSAPGLADEAKKKRLRPAIFP